MPVRLENIKRASIAHHQLCGPLACDCACASFFLPWGCVRRYLFICIFYPSISEAKSLRQRREYFVRNVNNLRWHFSCGRTCIFVNCSNKIYILYAQCKGGWVVIVGGYVSVYSIIWLWHVMRTGTVCAWDDTVRRTRTHKHTSSLYKIIFGIYMLINSEHKITWI